MSVEKFTKGPWTAHKSLTRKDGEWDYGIADSERELIAETYTNAMNTLDFSHSTMGEILGFEGNAQQKSMDIAKGRRRLSPPAIGLIQAYLDGYRPEGWSE